MYNLHGVHLFSKINLKCKVQRRKFYQFSFSKHSSKSNIATRCFQNKSRALYIKKIKYSAARYQLPSMTAFWLIHNYSCQCAGFSYCVSWLLEISTFFAGTKQVYRHPNSRKRVQLMCGKSFRQRYTGSKPIVVIGLVF